MRLGAAQSQAGPRCFQSANQRRMLLVARCATVRAGVATRHRSRAVPSTARARERESQRFRAHPLRKISRMQTQPCKSTRGARRVHSRVGTTRINAFTLARLDSATLRIHTYTLAPRAGQCAQRSVGSDTDRHRVAVDIAGRGLAGSGGPDTRWTTVLGAGDSGLRLRETARLVQHFPDRRVASRRSCRCHPHPEPARRLTPTSTGAADPPPPVQRPPPRPGRGTDWPSAIRPRAKRCHTQLGGLARRGAV